MCLAKLRGCNNICRVLKVWESERFCCTLSEFCSGGDLLSYLAQLPFYSEAFVADIMRQILQGIQFLHSNGVVHRDLKPHNVFVHAGLGGAVTIKLADFACSGSLETKKKMKHRYGTLFFTAPEVFEGEFDEKCDLWSCGVLLYLLLSGRLPFVGRSASEIEEAARFQELEFSSQAWEMVSDDVKELLRSLL